MTDMRAIYAWTEVDENGNEGVIMTMVPELGFSATLQHRRREVAAEYFKPYAEAHRQASGHRVRFVRFVRAEDLEELP